MDLNITLDGRRYYRSNNQRMIAGVCGGLADHFSLNVWLVRLLTIILFFALPGVSSFLVLALYIALAVKVPTAP